jgi:UDP-3-O-[3-hydroxymyristoyl] glucosamine N-acyltransferase
VKLRELAERLECRLEGDGDIEIHRVAGIELADAGDLTFFSNPRYAAALRQTRASAVIVSADAPDAPCAKLRSPHPYLAFANAVALFAPSTLPPVGIDPLAAVATDARIGEGVAIGPFVRVGRGVVIGDGTVIYSHVCLGDGAVIGRNCTVHAHVSIRERVVLGDRVVVQDGAVIGSDGYGFVPRPDGSHQKIPQTAPVIIEDDVEIGANTTIDRPAVGETRIRRGAKIDNLVQIAHGVTVGRDTLLAAQVGIAGSTAIGDRVTLAGQVGVAGHLDIGDGVRATAQTGIPNSVDAGALVSGYPAIDNRDWLRASAIFRKLPELRKTLLDMERRIAQLEAELAGRASRSR